MLGLLPVELIQLVLDKLDANTDLMACALSCQGLRTLSQQKLWQQISIRSEVGLHSLLGLLKASPHLGSYIRRLRISTACRWSSKEEHHKDTTDTVPTIDTLAGYLERIEDLSLIAYSYREVTLPKPISRACFQHTRIVALDGVFKTVDDFLAVLASFPHASFLTLFRVRITNFLWENMFRVAASPWLPPLYHLDVTASTIVPWTRFLYRWLAAEQVLHLRRLLVHHTSEGDWKYLGELIQRLSELQHLSLAAPLNPTRRPLVELISLDKCISLASLELKITIDYPQDPLLANWPTDLLATVNAPSLVRIDLTIPYQGKLNYSQVLLWNVLDELLSDTTRFPSLRDVVIAPQTAVEADEHPDIVEAQPALLPRTFEKGLLRTLPDNSMYNVMF
ncbi:hypothetical protein PUNSTDRAFT_134056 [Punctularia strigosozonata HHB-11173 SS5]|uniref:uncharacterized protein n=1 Tax=Punctularia strigosozonata (strain HHB-11173) TaxID=741275 RepID=UPI000441798E|nr:uncharacterized protein PUNSTDRAFT_134056 [Punctularia strigosozonata HHB-11173 SS5]EIN08883.1 hypothetical protein PUNSTDRAFT_134056 [Punctularia strigosozonata HHB-11173 SS5]